MWVSVEITDAESKTAAAEVFEDDENWWMFVSKDFRSGIKRASANCNC